MVQEELRVLPLHLKAAWMRKPTPTMTHLLQQGHTHSNRVTPNSATSWAKHVQTITVCLAYWSYDPRGCELSQVPAHSSHTVGALVPLVPDPLAQCLGSVSDLSSKACGLVIYYHGGLKESGPMLITYLNG